MLSEDINDVRKDMDEAAFLGTISILLKLEPIISKVGLEAKCLLGSARARRQLTNPTPKAKGKAKAKAKAKADS
eukprot:1137413-Pyramimonas_sp.AAC.1